jgi:hypothetical protein
MNPKQRGRGPGGGLIANRHSPRISGPARSGVATDAAPSFAAATAVPGRDWAAGTFHALLGRELMDTLRAAETLTAAICAAINLTPPRRWGASWGCATPSSAACATASTRAQKSRWGPGYRRWRRLRQRRRRPRAGCVLLPWNVRLCDRRACSRRAACV